MEIFDVKHKRHRRRRTQTHSPCTCPQCLMDAEVEAMDEWAFSDADEDFDDFDEGDLNDCDDHEFDDDLDIKASRKQQPRRRRQRGPCACSQCAVDAEVEAADLYDDAYDADCEDTGLAEEVLADNAFNWFDDEDDSDDFDADDLDESDGFDEDDDDLDDDESDGFDDEDDDNLDDEDDLDDFDDDVFDNELDSYDDDDDDFDDEDDLDDFDDDDLDDDEFDWREPKWKAQRDRAGKRVQFTTDEKEQIRGALALAHRWARRARRVFEGIWQKRGTLRRRWQKRRDAWKSWPDIVYWFGSGDLSRSQIRRTRRRVRKIERILNKRRIRFVKVQHQTGKRSYGCEREGGVHASAYAGRGGLRKISICPVFFGRDQTKTQAKTIIHELVHEIGFHHQLLKNQSRGAGGTGGATTTSQARQLTQENPSRARKNPTNYAELYATEFYGR